MSTLKFSINRNPVQPEISTPTITLLDWLREEQKLTGTKEGCNEGDCGACTVILSDLEDGKVRHRAVNSCILFLPQVHGKDIRTIEGLKSKTGNLHPVQSAMIKHHGSQCGFCTPGIIMSLAAAHASGDTQFDDVLAGNLCRCTGYAPIVKAAEAAAAEPLPDSFNSVTASLNVTHVPDSDGDLFIPPDLDRFAEWYDSNPSAVLVAGATDVGLWVTKQLRQLRPVCFIGQLDELADVRTTDEAIEFGAAVTIAAVREHMIVHHPDFAELLRRFGSVQVRNSATIGGNIANGSPIGDAAPALISLGAQLTLRKNAARRILPLEDFFIAYGKQDRQPGEFVESIRVPVQPDHLRCFKLSKRFDQDISAVCGCFNIVVENNRVVSVRIAYGGMAAVPKRAAIAERTLLNQLWSRETVERAIRALEEDFSPLSDARATKNYRMKSAQNMLLKCFLRDKAPAEPMGVLECQ